MTTKSEFDAAYSYVRLLDRLRDSDDFEVERIVAGRGRTAEVLALHVYIKRDYHPTHPLHERLQRSAKNKLRKKYGLSELGQPQYLTWRNAASSEAVGNFKVVYTDLTPEEAAYQKELKQHKLA